MRVVRASLHTSPSLRVPVSRMRIKRPPFPQAVEWIEREAALSPEARQQQCGDFRPPVLPGSPFFPPRPGSAPA